MKPYRIYYIGADYSKIYVAKYKIVDKGFRYTYRADQAKAKVFRFAKFEQVLTQLKTGVQWHMEVVEKPNRKA